MERSEAVQFTAMIDVASHYAIVAPLRLEPDILAFSYPLDGEIWIATIISVPLYILVMCLADYLFHPCGVITYVNVKANIGFVIRNTLTEHMNRLPDCRLYKKVFIFFWAMPISVVVMAYAGNLTAMITRDPIQYEHVVLKNGFCSGCHQYVCHRKQTNFELAFATFRPNRRCIEFGPIRPKVLMTPDNADQMLAQDEIKWAVWEKSLFAKVAKGA